MKTAKIDNFISNCTKDDLKFIPSQTRNNLLFKKQQKTVLNLV